jgi:hypothetical protein
MIDDLRTRIEGEEFDYQILVDSLKQYEHPRDKITKLLRQGAIIRVKKGIYIFGQRYARRPFSREILANMIYGPSCISLDLPSLGFGEAVFLREPRFAAARHSEFYMEWNATRKTWTFPC